MKQKFGLYKEKVANYWSSTSRLQKGILAGVFLLVLLLVIGGAVLAGDKKLVPLYNDLSLEEVGQIKAELDARAVSYQLENAGTTILVPEDQVDSLLVDLAAQGLPNSGNIDYSFFSANTSWGMTDNEFDVIQLDAMQTELANLMKSIEGIEDAKVMINKPQEPVFVSDQSLEASASIVINTAPGYNIEGPQVQSLYHLVSKTVPNLPTDNIVIMDQYFNYFDLNNSSVTGAANTYANNQEIKKQIERDIQRRVQQMVGMMVGSGKVIASVTADIDFTQENRIEELVLPADEETMEGLPVSVETIKETYTGNNPPNGGVAGTGEEEVVNYPAGEEDGNGDYEMVKESINNEFNRIKKEIVESPYKIRDLGIQVAVDNRKSQPGNETEPVYLSAAEENTVEEGIASILNSIVTTSIDESYGEVVPEEKTSIVFQEFNRQQEVPSSPTTKIPVWLYVLGAGLLATILILAWLLFKRRKQEEEVEEWFEEPMDKEEITMSGLENHVETESDSRKKQLEKLAKDKPEEFVKLLRGWITED